MKVIFPISQEFTAPMERYRKWVFAPATQARIQQILEPQLETRQSGELPCSRDFLLSMDHARHDGLPGNFLGINLNSRILATHIGQFDGTFIEEARVKSEELDRDLQNILGARVCALKMFYPAGGFIEWHTNWDSPGYNVIFTYSEGGKGYWRHVDPAGASGPQPVLDRLVHIDDKPGWHAKAGYFGRRDEFDKVVWHSAYTFEPRLTLSYIVYDKPLWENLVDELAEG